MMDDAVVIKISNLTKTFGKNVAVDNLDLEIQRGELFGLVGLMARARPPLCGC